VTPDDACVVTASRLLSAVAPSTRERPGSFRSLRVRNFRAFWIGQLVSKVGSWLNLTAVSSLVVTDLGGTGTHVGCDAGRGRRSHAGGGHGSPFVGVIAERLGTRTAFLYRACGALVGGALVFRRRLAAPPTHAITDEGAVR
jgi:hypothetical protein